MAHGKKYLDAAKLVDRTRAYPPDEAAQLVKDTTTVSFDASDVYGSGRTISSGPQFTLLVGGTKLNGPLPVGGTRTCVASYTGAYTPVSATCS